ncbi:hypothetical protein NAEGRDRAFT_59090 [Naegleria gruberi]|uniref:non-specific serine/threonine protein kinase n=1 Tax=Naegleria gruberi TaxID=5762 RepID=D2VSF0_NAEGR|nr:uncharacterized protein NAEGRDRAFT_59090 [Naegleria gruberi]EFC40107.1 hypothetical protein NAEGRDRAFT_59090 [Naegleria gruberi]|eukprot:XP_002672851.1 hypothetical protein NAEGRDRAFT_59090 [Naegleria gruberi strain NEG-M]
MAKQSNQSTNGFYLSVMMMIVFLSLCCMIENSLQQNFVTFNYYPNEGKLFSSDSKFVNVQGSIQSGYCNALLSDFEQYGASAFCFSDNAGLTIYLGYGYSLSGIRSGTDSDGRFVKIEPASSVDFSAALDQLTINPSRNSYMIVSAVGSYVNLPGARLSYSVITSDAKVNQYLAKRYQTQNPIIFFPLTELSGTSLQIQLSANSSDWNLARSASTIIKNVSYDRRTSYNYGKSSTKCVDYNCFIETMVNETLVDNPSVNYYFNGNLASSLNNFQMAKFTPAIFKLTSSSTTLKTVFTTNETLNTDIITDSFSLLTGYYLKNGDKIHSQSQPITIILESRDTNAFPLEAITSLNWYLSVSASVDLSQYSNKRYLTLPANIFSSNQVLVKAEVNFNDGTQITLSTTLYIQNIGTLTLTMDPTSPYLTSGAQVNLITYVNVPTVTIQSVVYEDSASKYISLDSIKSEFNTSSIISATLKADTPGSLSFMQTIKLTSGISLYNYISTKVMPKYPLISGCSVLPSYGIGYEDLFGVSCPMALDQTKISSVRVEVYQDTEKLFTLFNTKTANFATRLPLTLATTSSYVQVTITDIFGYSHSSVKFYYSASMNQNYPTTLLGRIERIQFYLSQTKARNFQTATNYGILLNLLTNGMLTSATAIEISQYSVQWNSFLDYFVSELDILRRTIFHSSVYDRAVPLLAPLLREIVDFADKVSAYTTLISTKKQVLVQNAEFLISNDKSGWLSTRDRAAIVRILGSVTASDQTTFWNVTSLTDISDFSTAFKSQLSKLDSMFNRGLDLSPFGFNKQISKFDTLFDLSSAQRSISGLTVQMPALTLNDYGYPANSYSLLLTSYDISTQVSSKKFSLSTGNYSRFCGNTLFSIDVGRSDGSILGVSGLSSPIILTMDLSLDSSLATSISSVNFTCRYLAENNMWSTSGVATEVVTVGSASVKVRCKSNHLSTFTVFADDVYVSTTNNSTTSNTDKVIQSGLSQGEIAAAVVVPVVVVLIITVIIIGIVIFLLLRMKRKKKANTAEPKKMKKEINAYQADSVKYDDLKIEMSSNMFISDYKSLNSNTIPSATSVQSTETPTSYNVTTPSTSTNVINKKYEILEKIGAGGFGAVFRARNLFFNHGSKTVNDLEYYAIKKIQLSGLSELNDKFKEAVNMFKIRHENLVSLEDAVVDESTNSLYLVMKFYGNGDLDHFVKSKRMLPEQVLKQIIVQVCRGLKYLEEERGLIHRDIKPSNVFVEYFDSERDNIKVVVSDFGLAKESNMMTSVSFAGTPFFMSPQALIGSKYSFNADIFSLGCSIFLMITHDMSSSIAQLYFQKAGNQGQVHEFIRDNIKKACQNSRTISYSDEFIDILLKLMEFDADTRPNAAKVLEMIENSVEITTV